MKLWRRLMVVGGLVVLGVLASTVAVMAAEFDRGADGPRGAVQIWSTVPEALIVSRGPRWIVPQRYRVVALNGAALRAVLEAAPREFSPEAETTTTVLALPRPDGGESRFRIVDSPIMEAGLAARYPEIRTFAGQGLDDPTATVRLDVTPAGFHAMILSAAGTVFIDPFQRNDTVHYVVYDKRDYARPADEEWTCLVGGADHDELDLDHLDLPAAPAGDVLRIYRLANAATGEYTAFHGGTVQAGLAAVVTSVNRVDAIYEQEVAVRLVLIDGNDKVIYTDGATDPYTNNNGVTMLGQNQTNLDTVIGSANYDIGHVFSTGGGGVASLRVPCTNSKARGVTGRSQPVGDAFDVDYVAHEMGHQFGGNHSFNGTTGACNGNRASSAAYEPGSGSTIMAYAGICGSENLQPNSDPYFHTRNFDEIMAFVTGVGSTCAVTQTTGNTAPLASAGPDYAIPANTPFALTGAGSDANGDPLTFGWEQFDLGAASPPNTDDGTRPIFRSFNPTTSTVRVFPRPTDLLSNTSTLGEALPTTNRTLTFRLTVRDNRSGGGGVQYDTMALEVVNSAGPFSVTLPNTAFTWRSPSTQTVTWNVAETDKAPISCLEVDVLLSADGGYTFPYTLTTGAPNNGIAEVALPEMSTTQARLKVQCHKHVFFDVSNVDGVILPPLKVYLPLMELD